MSACGGSMEPIGSFQRPNGEYVIVHYCLGCGFERFNRIAADDDFDLVLSLPSLPPRTSREVKAQRLQGEVTRVTDQEFARISKRSEVDIVVSTVAPDDVQSLPNVDIREFLNSADYTGPTKKGIRFPWQKLPEVIAVMQTQDDSFGGIEG